MMPSLEQLDLTQRLKDGDEQVLEDILRQIGPQVRAVLLKKYSGVLGEADFDDALSLGLYRVWNSRNRFDETRSSLRVWFFRIVENAARDILRVGWHKAKALEVNGHAGILDRTVQPEPTEPPDADNRPPTVLQMALRDILGSLSEAQRTIVMADAASRDGTANNAWLAKELGLAASSIRVYRRRALEKIRNEMRKRGHEVP
jgi:RNA polymerase sigma factor (sigma-70 family)